MTVGELIEELKDMPRDAKVTDGLSGIDVVYIDEDDGTVVIE
jgi:hypothetical protein